MPRPLREVHAGGARQTATDLDKKHCHYYYSIITNITIIIVIDSSLTHVRVSRRSPETGSIKELEFDIGFQVRGFMGFRGRQRLLLLLLVLLVLLLLLLLLLLSITTTTTTTATTAPTNYSYYYNRLGQALYPEMVRAWDLARRFRLELTGLQDKARSLPGKVSLEELLKSWDLGLLFYKCSLFPLDVFVCVYVYLYMYVQMYLYVHVQVYVHVYMCGSLSLSLSIYIYRYVCSYTLYIYLLCLSLYQFI